MKLQSIVIATIASIALHSCSKNGNSDLPKYPQGTYSAPQKRDGGDDDGPIIMEVTKDIQGSPLSGASVTWIKGTDTIKGSTDNAGECTSILSKLGQWRLKIDLAGFVCVQSTIDVTDSFAQHIDTLVEGHCQ